MRFRIVCLVWIMVFMCLIARAQNYPVDGQLRWTPPHYLDLSVYTRFADSRCGEPAPPLINYKDYPEVTELKVGDTVWSRLGWNVMVSVKSLGNNEFEGESYGPITLVWFTLLIRQEFQKVKMVMYKGQKTQSAGRIVSKYDANWEDKAIDATAALKEAVQLETGGGGGDIKTGKEEPPTSFSAKFSVKDIIIQSVDNKSISVSVRGEAKNVSFPLSLPFKALETNNEDRNPLAAKPEAGVPITDAEGRIYEVNDAGKTMQIGQQGKDITPQEYSQETRKMTYALKNSNKKIFFKAYEKEPLAFDAWQQVFAGKKIIEDEYENIGEAYRVPQKLIPVGMTGKVRVDLNGLHKDSVIFKTPAGSVYLLQEDNILSIASGKDQDGIEIFARNKNDSTQVYGKLKVVSYKPKELKVHLVPVDVETQINKDALEKELNKIYYAYGINISVIVENNIRDKSWDINNDGKLDVGEGAFLSRYTNEMRALNQTAQKPDAEAVYLFLLKKASDDNVKGDMPIKSQFGYLFDSVSARNVSHELGHGFFQLEHTFEDKYQLTQGSTNNLMDYADGSKLYKFQWDLMHNKGLKLFSFLQDSSAGKQLENLLSQFKKPKELNEKIPDVTKAEKQHYECKFIGSRELFERFKLEFSISPHKFLSNSKAIFNKPVDGDEKETSFKTGNFIKIDVKGPLNNCYIKIKNVSSNINSLSAEFVTMDGHIEKGIITFLISYINNNIIEFQINSLSEVDMGILTLNKWTEKFARSEQKESWYEVIEKVKKYLFNNGVFIQ